MKTFFHILLIAGVTCFMLSCEGDQATNRLRVMGKMDPFSTEELLFTSDDIVSYNETTFEIKLTDLAVDKLISKQIVQQQEYKSLNYPLLSFYFNNKILFRNIINSQIGGERFNCLVFVADQYSNKFYLADGYPVIREYEWDNIYKDREEYKKDMRKAREENAQKRAVEWNVFIKYLSDTGKIVK